MSSVFPVRSMSDALPASKAAQVPFLSTLKTKSKSKSKPELIRKLARTASAKNSLDLSRPSCEQACYYDDGGDGARKGGDGLGGAQKLNRSGSALSGFSGNNLEVGGSGRSARGLKGMGRGASYHTRSTSGTSGISAWSAQTRESGGSTPVGGGFRHPWQQTPTVQRENSVGAAGGAGGSYNEPSGFGGRGRNSSDEDLQREREREMEMQGRRSLQLGAGYGLGLDGVDEGFERYDRPIGRSNTSIDSKQSGSGASNRMSRASCRAEETRSYTPISALPPPLAGSRGLGVLRVNTGGSGIAVAGTAGRGAGAGGIGGGYVTPQNGSSSRVNLGSLHGAGGSNPDVNATSAVNFTSTPLIHNSANNNSSFTNTSTLYNTATSSNQNLHQSALTNSFGQLHTSTSAHTTPLSPHPSTTPPPHGHTPSASASASASAFAGRARASMDFPRLRGLSEPKGSERVTVEEARRRWNEKERLKGEERARKEEKKMRKRGRTSTTSVGSFRQGKRGRADTAATNNTAGTYETAMGTQEHRRHGEGATGGNGKGGTGAGRGCGNSWDLDDPSNVQAAYLDTGEAYAPSEGELAAASAAAAGAAAAARGGRQGEREGSPRVKEVKRKIYEAKSRSHSKWAGFMLWLKTRLLKMGRQGKKIVNGKGKGRGKGQ